MEPIINTTELGFDGQYRYLPEGATIIISSATVNMDLSFRRTDILPPVKMAFPLVIFSPKRMVIYNHTDTKIIDNSPRLIAKSVLHY